MLVEYCVQQSSEQACVGLLQRHPGIPEEVVYDHELAAWPSPFCEPYLRPLMLKYVFHERGFTTSGLPLDEIRPSRPVAFKILAELIPSLVAPWSLEYPLVCVVVSVVNIFISPGDLPKIKPPAHLSFCPR